MPSKKAVPGLYDVKQKLRAVDRCFLTDKIAIHEVVQSDITPTLGRKIEGLRVSEQMLDRLRKCRTASEVFGEFSVDAAHQKIDEMMNAQTSDSRQRAQETVLEYALGKPINRMMSMTMQISDAKDEEIDQHITQLLTELGYQTGEGTSSAIVIDAEGGTGPDETK